MNILKQHGINLRLFFLFLMLHSVLYCSILFFHGLFPFDRFNYQRNAHHYFSDPQATSRQFQFLRALGQYDAQWYLKIAEQGYPNHPRTIDNTKKQIMDGLTYAFFPLYPFTLAGLNHILHHVELTAFIESNILIILNFFSMLYVLSKFVSRNAVYKTIFLIFFFPFSVFYRSYFTEGLYLFLLLWFAYFMLKDNLLMAVVSLALLNITKANGFLLNFYLLYILYGAVKSKKITVRYFIVLCSLLCAPFLIWMYFCFQNTGNPFYFFMVRSSWFEPDSMPALLHNIISICMYPFLPLHTFHYSKIETITILFSGFFLILAKKKLSPLLWWIGVLLFLTPLISTDTTSFSRYQSVSFPLFLSLSLFLEKKYYLLVLCIFFFLSVVVSLLFVNWYWIG